MSARARAGAGALLLLLPLLALGRPPALASSGSLWVDLRGSGQRVHVLCLFTTAIVLGYPLSKAGRAVPGGGGVSSSYPQGAGRPGVGERLDHLKV